MYSSTVIARNLDALEAKTGLKLVRYEVSRIADFGQAIHALRLPDGKFKRPLNKEEQAFIRNEVLLSKYDFRYWFERYYNAPRDGMEGGGVGRLRLWESQELLLRIISKLEADQWEQWDRHKIADGVLIVDHKARQLGHTGFCRGLMLHRATLCQNERAAAGSVDEKKIHELYERDKLA